MSLFRTILVAADFSGPSREAFRVSCSLADEKKTRLILLHVAEPEWVAEEPVYLGQRSVQFTKAPRDEIAVESLRRTLREAYAPARPVDVDYRTSEGAAAGEILRAAEAVGADLIAMGTHGRKGLDRMLTGSVAETVLRGARCPVLALRSRDLARKAEEPRAVLHPTDFSDASEPALRVARSLARDRGARLILLHVVPLTALVGETASDLVEESRAYRDALERLRARLDRPDLKEPVETRLAWGDAAAEIVRAAAEFGCGLVVMGTHGRTGLGRLLMGSVAESVLRAADCPVLAVKAAPPAPPAAHERTTSESVSVF
jgi:nucleotide-binding universal stress UspA family protein